MCETAVERDKYEQEFANNQYKTQGACKKSVERELYVLCSGLDQYRTQKNVKKLLKESNMRWNILMISITQMYDKTAERR